MPYELIKRVGVVSNASTALTGVLNGKYLVSAIYIHPLTSANISVMILERYREAFAGTFTTAVLLSKIQLSPSYLSKIEFPEPVFMEDIEVVGYNNSGGALDIGAVFSLKKISDKVK